MSFDELVRFSGDFDLVPALLPADLLRTLFKKHTDDFLSFGDFGSLLAQCGVEAFRSGNHKMDDSTAEENIHAFLNYMELAETNEIASSLVGGASLL